CSSLAVTPGQYVTKGQTIAYIGSTGTSTGNHLHFEIRIGGSTVNPLPYIQNN
ncbi:MAG: M23 family metallopeptidase, partial [Oscillospiraceae bacterium]